MSCLDKPQFVTTPRMLSIESPENMAEQPLISICMITFNHEAYVAQAIEGVLIQKTNFPIELVIGEDCSNDRTKEVCIEYARKYPKIIRLLLNDRNIGMMPNFIQSFQACRGKYIALCEGDDYWTDPIKLEKQVKILDEYPYYTMVASNSVVLYQESQNFSHSGYDFSEFAIVDMLSKNLLGLSTSSFMIRRDCISNANLLTMQGAPFGDWALSLFTLKKGKGAFIKDALSCYRIHQEGAWSGMSLVDKIKNNLNMYDFILHHFPEHKCQILKYKKTYEESTIISNVT